MACLFGALVGATPQLRSLFIGPTAPMACLFDALRTMGSAYLPTVLLVLAGSLAQGLKQLDTCECVCCVHMGWFNVCTRGACRAES